MKLRSVRYLTGEGIKNVWVNRLMSIASVGVLAACMLIIGVAVALSLNIDLALGNLEQQNVVMVYFNDEAAVRYDDSSTAAVGAAGSSGSDASDNSDAQSSDVSGASSDNTSSAVSDTASAASSGTVSGSTAETAATVLPLSQSNGYDISAEAAGGSASGEKIVTEDEAREICNEISAIPNVASVEFISGEEGLRRMLDNMDDTQASYFTWLEEDNPLSCAARVTMLNLDQFDQTVAEIEAIDGINTVYHQRDLAMRINSIKNGISVAGIWIIALLMVISLVIVANTIRVTMYNRKLEISIMKAVGATNSFIRLPFVVEGIVIGLVSAGLSIGILYFVYRGVIGTMQEALGLAAAVPFREFVWPTLGIFAAIGVLAGLVGSSIMISKYLRKEGSEFRAL